MNPTLLDFMEAPFTVEKGYVRHPNIKENVIGARDFQINVAEKALHQNTMVVVPTGLGKTIIAVLVAAEVLLEKEAKVLIVAPTRPLVNQHRDSFEKFLLKHEMSVFTGAMKPKERVSEWERARIVFSTPQTIRNDILKERYGFHDLKLLVVDEAHKSVGSYAYVPIAKRFAEQSEGVILGLTASPGGDKEKIEEVLGNLHIRRVEAREREDADVREYVKEIEVTWLKTKLTERQREIQKPLEELLYERIERLRKIGFVRYKRPLYVSKKDLIDIGNTIRGRMRSGRRGYLFGALQNQSIAFQVYHLLELLETQGVRPMRDYMERLRQEDSKTKRILLNDRRVRKAYDLVKEYEGDSHPKMELLKDVMVNQFRQKRDSLVIVFAQYRDTIESILSVLEELPDAKPVRFVGQASRRGSEGLTQERQKEILEQFKTGMHNTLVASSVAEEGIDIPDVDLVIFYEPIPSEIRSIQRRGRTGRSSIGKVVVLITEDTRDEAYLRAEVIREKKMHKMIGWLKEES